MLTRVWQEFEYRIDVCTTTDGAVLPVVHASNISSCQKKLSHSSSGC
jgi:hypothetical protein